MNFECSAHELLTQCVNEVLAECIQNGELPDKDVRNIMKDREFADWYIQRLGVLKS